MLKQIEDIENNLREKPRMSDIYRAADKYEPKGCSGLEPMPDTNCRDEEPAVDWFGLGEQEAVANPSTTPAVTFSISNTGGGTVPTKEILYRPIPYSGTAGNQQTKPTAYDKNSPESLKNLRWSIYEVIDNYQGDYGKTIAGCLKQEVERLFQEYTNS